MHEITQKSPAAAPSRLCGYLFTALALLLTLALIAANQYVSQFRDDETDAWLFRYYGRQMAAGYKLYFELWDNKPPGIYWMNALMARAGSNSPWAACVVCGATTLLACWGMGQLTWQVTRQRVAALLAGLWGAIYVLHPFFMVGGDRAQTFVAAAEIWAAYFYVHSMRDGGRSRWYLLACGFFCALAVLFLQTAVAVPLAIVATELLSTIRRSMLGHTGAGNKMGTVPVVRGIFRIGHVALGAGLILAMATGTLWLTSDLSAAYDAIIRYPLSCAQSGLTSGSWSWQIIPDALAVCWMPFLVSLAGIATWKTAGFAALAGLPVERTLDKGAIPCPDAEDQESGQPPEPVIEQVWFFLISWFAIALLIAMSLPNRKWHYLASCVPPLVLLASLSLGMFWRHRPTGWRGFPVWLVLVWMLSETYPPIRSHVEKLSSVYYWANQDPGASRADRIARWIRENTEPGSTLFVVGFDPEIYALANRPPASRYAGTFWAFQQPHGGQMIADEIMREFATALPGIIVGDVEDIRKLAQPDDVGEHAGAVFWGLDTLLVDYDQADEGLPQVWIRR